jgi:O-antigen/teichoic acid export membrane protein
LPNFSISSRFIVSALSNLLRGGLAFMTTIIIARVLGPEKFGDYAFLLGSFLAVTTLLDMGTSNAFQTFISQKERGRMFVFSYAGWQLLQMLVVLLVIGIVLPEKLLDQIWLSHERGIILLGFTAVFMQQKAWRTIVQIGESKRLTHRTQLLNLSLAATHLLLVISFWVGGILSVGLIFGLVLVEYLIFLVVGYKVLFVSKFQGELFNGKSVLNEYATYCSPLIIYSILGFGYEFADRWMLQNFGGSKQQGLYEVGFRFGMVSLLVTTAVLNIFWKEIAEAKEKGNFELMQNLYRKVSRSLFFLGAVLAGFIIPWSKEIIQLVFGSSYMGGSSIFVLMLIYAAFRSLAQVNLSMLLATSKTKTHLVFGCVLMGVSIPCSYFVLASEDTYIPGLGLGSLGLAMKMVLFAVIHVNSISWWIYRDHGWKFDWIYQVVALGGAISCGWLSFELVEVLNNVISINLFLKGILALFLYCGFVGMLTWRMPWVAGVSRQEIKNFFFKLVQLSWI